MTNVSIHIELSNMYLKRRTHIFSSTGSKGDDILNAGIGTENKKIIGEALNYAYDLILKKPGWNRKDYLIQMIKKRFSSDIDT